jgi:hypothetical protein
MKKTFYLFLLILLPAVSFAQSLTGVSPSAVNAGVTLDVTITGSSTHFTDPNGTHLYFGFASGSSTSQDCINSMTVVDDVTLQANISVPSYATGNYNVQVINSVDGTIPPGSIFVIGNAATLTAVTPNTAAVGQTLDVTITGSNTHFLTNTNEVTFSMGTGTINVNSVTAVSNTTLTANVTVAPNTYSGYAHIFVSNNQDGTMELTNALSVTGGLIPAHVVSINPGVVHEGQTFNLLIAASGSNFTQTTNTVEVGTGYGFVVNSVDAFNDSLLLANVTVPTGIYTGFYNVKVTNSWNGTIQAPYLVVYAQDQPSSSSFTATPNSANAGQTLTVTITGTNTSFTQASTTSSSVSLYSMPTGEGIPGSFTIVDDTTITAVFTIPENHIDEDMDISVDLINSTSNMYVYLSNHLSFHITGPDPLFGFVIPTPESAENACDGASQIVVSGGTAPYAYTIDGTTTGSAIATGLCEGLHDATVTDASGESIDISFVMVPPNGVYTTQTYIDSIMNDTIYNNAITQCTIDYNTIDSIYIESVAQLSNNQVLITWYVAYGVGQHMNITDVYDLSNFSGVYTLALELFCPNKSLNSFLIAYDQFNYVQGVAGLIEQAPNDAVVYPNPFNGNISIAWSNEQEATILLMDLTGKTVLTTTGSGKLIQLETGQLASGQYLLVAKGTTSSITRKVIKL